MSFAVKRLTSVSDAQIQALVDLLIDCVEGGASVSFMSPLSVEKATAFWRRVAAATARDERVLLVAEDESGIVGTAQLILDLPENQPHRADLSKMLVHRRARCRGVGAAVLRAVEELARTLGKSLLVLDTASPDAERLYSRLGWVRVGAVPDYALLPHGGFCATTFFYRRLDSDS
jgi:GNAT superfamily N-acetyltransferase